MVKVKLGEVISMKLGLNWSRQDEEHRKYLTIYNNNDLMDDLNGVNEITSTAQKKLKPHNHAVNKGDIVYSFINSISAIVSEANCGKVINQNFAKIEVDETKINKKYLCYLLNKDKDIKKLKTIAMQGSQLRKLSPTSIKDFEVVLPTVDIQWVIGDFYFEWTRRQELIKRQYEREDILFSEFLNILKMD